MPRFVVQEHNAKKAGLHYDFRLERNGMFKSWVIPKLPVTQRCKLAIQVSDHSEECAYYEGEYGPGYGEGSVKIWDQGTYEAEYVINDDQWKFTLRGNKLNGPFILTRKKGTNNQWFLIEG